MQRLVLMITISKRNNSEKILSFLSENKVAMTLGRYGRGTANDEMLNYLGLGEREKCIAFSTVLESKSKYILNEIEKKMNLNARGEGLAFTIPISSVGGKIAFEYMTGNNNEIIESGENKLDGKNELIVIVTNRGYVDMVMEAAREGGAVGGTVMHARGTGLEQSDKFFGANIGAEKEMIFIVSQVEKRNDIMKSVMERAGIDSPAGSIMFTLPVIDVAGLIV